MIPLYESELTAQLSRALCAASTVAQVLRVHIPARDAHASVHVPVWFDVSEVLSIDYGSLYGVPLVASVRLINGWLLFTFTPEFFSALVDEINRTLPAPSAECETHTENRMYALSRHAGTGCPDKAALHRALLLALVASQSPAACKRAERAANALFHTIPPRERPALIARCGALGGAMLRLLSNSR